MPESDKNNQPEEEKSSSEREHQQPWEAVETEMVNVPNPFPDDFPVEKRAEIIRSIGEEMKEKFNEKYTKIGDWFTKYDSLYILSFSSYYFLTHPEGVDPEATGELEFYPFFQELLQAFALTRERNIDAAPLQDDANRLHDEMQEIGSAMSYRRMADLPREADEKTVKKFMVRTKMITKTTAVRNWAYQHQMERVTIELAERIDDEFFELYGVKSSVLMKILFRLIDKKTEELNTHRNKLSKCVTQPTYKKIIKEYNKIFPETEKIKKDEMKKLWEMAGEDEESLGVMLLMHSDLRLNELYELDVDYLLKLVPEEEIDREKLQQILDLLSIEFGELSDHDYEHFILNNPVHTQPFIDLENGKYFTGVLGAIPHTALDILESLVWDKENLQEKYSEARSNYLEDETEKMVKEHFPSGEVYRGSKYGNDYENDITLVIDNFAIVIEAKSGRVTDYAKRAAPHEFPKIIKRLIEEPSDQALRFVDFLKSHQKVHRLETDSGEINLIDSRKIDYYIPLGITFSELSIISGNLKPLIQAGLLDRKLEELAPSMSFTDFEIVLELLEFESERIHYLSRRREFESHVEYEGDEIDLLSFYIDTGFNIGEEEYSDDLFLGLPLKSKELDPYIIGKNEGIDVKKPTVKKTRWWRDIIKTASNNMDTGWLDTCFILHNFAYEDQRETERRFNELRKRIINGNTDKPHNWLISLSGPDRRKYGVVFYPYLTFDTDLRNSIMEEALEKSSSYEGLRGLVIVGHNIIRPHYPYNVLGRSASTDFFDLSH